MTTQQPEALRLAEMLEDRYALGNTAQYAAAELRRQHSRITELESQLAAIGAIDMNTQHIMDLADMYAHAKVADDCPPEKLPRNLLKAAVEDMEATHLRELAAYRLTVENLDRETAAQQPAPSAAVALSDDLRDRLVAISEAIADQDDRAAQAMLRKILAAPQPAPTPQADSQPAPALPRVKLHLPDGDSRTAKVGFSEWKDGVLELCVYVTQPAPVLGYPPLPEQLSFEALASAPGCAYSEAQMRAYIDADRAARAPADSVTAPAEATNTKTHELLSTTVGLLMGYREGAARQPYKPGGVIAKVVYEVVDHLKDWPYPEPIPPAQTADSVLAELAEADRRAGAAERALAVCKEDVARFEQVRDKMKYQWGSDRRVSFDEVWAEALALKAERQEGSVLEDAARLDWLDQQCEGYGFQDIHEGNRWEISGPYANVRQAIDYERAARKQGEKQ